MSTKPTSKNDSISDWVPWKREVAGVAVLYRLAVVKQEIAAVTAGTELAFLEPLLDELSRAGLIGRQLDGRWGVTEDGAATIRTAMQVYDHVLKFEIFAKVDLGRPLGDDEANPESPNQVLDRLYDPRFGNAPLSDEPGAWEDLRLAAMAFVHDTGGCLGTIDLHRLVFVQKLAAGHLWSPSFWTDLRLGSLFDEIEMVAETSVTWREVGETEEEATAAMRALYTAGMVEQRKRDGRQCSKCGTPLALCETLAKEARRPLLACPNPVCGASLGSGSDDGETECPLCHAGLEPSQRICGCGVHLDYALPPGTIREACVTDTVEEVVPAWGTYYDPLFVPYGYYDPWAWSASDARAFAVVCGPLW